MPFHLLMSFYKNYIGVIFYQEWSLTTLVWFLSYTYTRNFFFYIAEASPVIWLVTQTR